jgi:DNA-binding phage protein
MGENRSKRIADALAFARKEAEERDRAGRAARAEAEGASGQVMKALMALRKQRGISVAEAARRMGAARALVARLERSGNPTLDTLARYAAAVGAVVEVRALPQAPPENR